MMKTKFSWRAFISFALTYAIIVILVSGIILYIAPPGRYAHWVNWEIWGFTKEGWQAVHTIFSFTFIILSVFHLFSVNWKAFVSYLKSKTTSGLNKKHEFLSSTGLIIVFFLGTVFTIPPFNAVMNLGEDLTNSWEKVEERAPVPHAELLTLAELADQLNFSSVDEISRKLDNHKIVYENVGQQTLQEIATINNSTPSEIYEVIDKKAGNSGQGMGIGRKTIEDFAVEFKMSVEEILKILEENNIDAEKGQTLRTIGENNDLPPRDVYKLFSE